MSDPRGPGRFLQPAALFLFLFALAALFNFREIRVEKGIVLIPGERPSRANFTPFVARDAKFQQGRSVEILAATLPPAGYYSLLYRFRVLKKDTYAVLIAGTPPGADQPNREADWFSPYEVAVDSGSFFRLTDASFKKAFPVHPQQTDYVQGGYRWSRVASLDLSEGWHTIEIRVSEKRLRDGKVAFFLDSILLAPKNFKPKRLLKNLDPRFFA